MGVESHDLLGVYRGTCEADMTLAEQADAEPPIEWSDTARRNYERWVADNQKAARKRVEERCAASTKIANDETAVVYEGAIAINDKLRAALKGLERGERTPAEVRDLLVKATRDHGSMLSMLKAVESGQAEVEALLAADPAQVEADFGRRFPKSLGDTTYRLTRAVLEGRKSR